MMSEPSKKINIGDMVTKKLFYFFAFMSLILVVYPCWDISVYV